MAYDDPVTEKQLDYIYKLIEANLLGIVDFPTSKSYYRKKTLARYQADGLIKLACRRRQKDNEESSRYYTP